jgi:hypothetical protein
MTATRLVQEYERYSTNDTWLHTSICQICFAYTYLFRFNTYSDTINTDNTIQYTGPQQTADTNQAELWTPFAATNDGRRHIDLYYPETSNWSCEINIPTGPIRTFYKSQPENPGLIETNCVMVQGVPAS